MILNFVKDEKVRFVKIKNVLQTQDIFCYNIFINL